MITLMERQAFDSADSGAGTIRLLGNWNEEKGAYLVVEVEMFPVFSQYLKQPDNRDARTFRLELPLTGDKPWTIPVGNCRKGG